MSGPRRAAALIVGGLALLAGARGAAPAPGGWEPDRRLTVDPGRSLTTYNFARGVAAAPGGRVHVVWYDDRGGSPQIYIRRSLDHGATWEPDRLLSPGFEQAEHPAVASSGQTVLVVWHGRKPGATSFDVFLRRSLDGGRSWGPAAALTASHAAAHCAVALSGLTVQVVWGDTRSGLTEIFTRHSSDAGRTWEPALRLTRNAANSWAPSLAVAGSRVHLSVVADGDHVTVLWYDERDGNPEVYFKHRPR